MARPSSCARYQLVLLTLLYLLQCKLAGAALLLTLEEPGSMENKLVQVNNVTSTHLKTINLVFGRQYHMHCKDSERRNGASFTAVWFFGDNKVPESNSTDPNHAMVDVFSYFDGSKRTLVFANYSSGNVGVYGCRERGSRNTADGAGIILRFGNPTVVTGAQNKTLTSGQHSSTSRISLIAFISGTPYPSPSNITWLFNNGSLPSNVATLKNELFLPSSITSAIEGVFSCHVTTSAGTASDDIHITLNYPPVVSITPSESQRRRINSTVTFYCQDSEGVPPPTFTWMHNGSSLSDGSHVTIANETSSILSFSSLTIANLQPSDSGDYKCTATNVAGFSHHTITLIVREQDPPAPPTNIRVTTISSCSIQVEWAWPQTPPTNDVASPDYAVFEVNLIGESRWTEIGRANITRTSLDVRIPSSGLNTRFQLRAKCVSDSIGDGPYFTVDDMYTLYSQDTLLSLSPLSSRVLSSSSIQLSWNIPEQQNCYNISSFTVLCSAVTGEANTTLVRGIEVSEAPTTITGLEPATSYNCSISTNLTERLVGEFSVQVKTYLQQATTTYLKFDLFYVKLRGIRDCEMWINEGAAAKKRDIAMAITKGIEELCACGFTLSYVKMSQLQCSTSSPTTVSYSAELHETQNHTLPELVSVLKQWVESGPSIVVQAQPVQIDATCFSTGESVQCETETESHPVFGTYHIVGIAVGVAVVLIVVITIATVAIGLSASRHRKKDKSTYTSNDAYKSHEAAAPVTSCSASNPVAIMEEGGRGGGEGEEPFYEQMDSVAHVEPQYESLEEYDRLNRNHQDVGKAVEMAFALCPAYESLETSNAT